jgi:hypothetical protein
MQHIFTLYFGDEFILSKTHHKINDFHFSDIQKSRAMLKKKPFSKILSWRGLLAEKI